MVNKNVVNFKMVGKIIFSVLVIAIFFFLVTYKSKNSTDSIVFKEEGVSSEQIEEDISKLYYIEHGIIDDVDPFDVYRVNKINIDKRQTNIEQKNDIIYCFVNISNECYESNVYLKLTYNLYNGGLWILNDDECFINQCESKPLQTTNMVGGQKRATENLLCKGWRLHFAKRTT